MASVRGHRSPLFAGHEPTARGCLEAVRFPASSATTEAAAREARKAMLAPRVTRLRSSMPWITATNIGTQLVLLLASVSAVASQCAGYIDASTADLSGSAYVSGAGFVGFTSSADQVSWTVTGCEGGGATIFFGYALESGNRPLDVVVNGVTVAVDWEFSGTGSWTSWGQTDSLNVVFNAGINTIMIHPDNAVQGAMIDYLHIEPAPVPEPEPEPVPEVSNAAWIVAGNVENEEWGNLSPLVCAGTHELHEVRCCSDMQLPGYTQSATCPVWGESTFTSASILSMGQASSGVDADGCNHGATFDHAKMLCEADGGRLCTRAELLAKCTAGTGCQHDIDLVWSGTSCTANQVSEPEPTVQQQLENNQLKVGSVWVGSEWVSVNTSAVFANPVLITAINSYMGPDTAAVRSEILGPSVFRMRIVEQDCLDSAHVQELVAWMIMEPMTGYSVQADTVLVGGGLHAEGATVNSNLHYLSGRGATVAFSTQIENPIVVGSIQTNNFAGWRALRAIPIASIGAEVWVQQIGAEEQADVLLEETAGWLAVGAGYGATPELEVCCACHKPALPDC